MTERTLDPKLFGDLTYEQARENFVRARFREDDHFETEEPERRMFEVLSTSNKFWWMRRFDRKLSPTLSAKPLTEQVEILRRYAQGEERVPGQWVTGKHWQPILDFLRQSLDPRQVLCYRAPLFQHNGLILVNVSTNATLVITGYAEQDVWELSSCGWRMVLAAILSTWKEGGPKASKARDFLIERIKECIAEVRKEAEADFDRAVAVSADGRKIVCADSVFVCNRNGSWRVFPGEAFRDSKIKKSGLCLSVGSQMWGASTLRQMEVTNPGFLLETFFGGPGTVRQVLSGVADRDYQSADQKLIRLDGSKVFITPDKYCSDPLPDGGEVISG